MKSRFQIKRPSGKRLFLRLPLNAEAPVAWWYGDPKMPLAAETGHIAGLDRLDELPDSLRQSPTVLWLPAEQCVLEQVTFNGKAKLRPDQLAQILGDSLGEDVSEWRWWRMPTTGPHPLLLGCPKEWITEMLTAVYTSDLQVTQILPELAALPAGTAAVTRAGGRWLFREEGGRGVWLHPDWVAEMLPQWRAIDTIALYGPAPFPNASWAAEHPECGEALLASHSANCGVNLLPKLPPSLRPRSEKRYWPWAAGFLAAAMVLSLVGTLGTALYFHLQARDDHQQVNALYQGWFPKDKRDDVDAYDKIRRQRHSLIQQFGTINFFNAFWQYAQLQSQWAQPQVQHLLFDRDKRTLTLAVNLSETDAKKAMAEAKRAGFTAKFATPRQGRVIATFTFRGANAN